MKNELKQEAPKRKRRTRAEMEAARAAGEVPAKRVKKVVEPKTSLPTEQRILIMSCLNKKVSDTAIKAASENGVEVVLLEEKVIHDYLTLRDDESHKTLEKFLKDTSNRLHSENQCVKLWKILTNGAEIEAANGVSFTRTHVVKETNLSHKQATQILQLLQAFGMIKYTKGIYEFEFVFDKATQHKAIQSQVVSVCKSVNDDILRFKGSIENDSSMTKEDKASVYEAFKKTVISSIDF